MVDRLVNLSVMRGLRTILSAALSAVVATSVQSETSDFGRDVRFWVAPAQASALYSAAPSAQAEFLTVASADADLFPLPAPTLEGFRPAARPIYMLRYPVTVQTGADVRPKARDNYIPAARWDNRPEGDLWTRAALTALRDNAPGLVDVVPRDIETWCPAYEQNSDARRRAFWVGLMSTLAWHESRHRPTAVGGGNQWFGLLQIFPPTARGYNCRATTGQALTNPIDNLRCATRIMAVTVPRDNAIAVHDGRWRGIAADWGPMVSSRKRQDMINWVSGQDYCLPQLSSVPIPPSRPLVQQTVADLTSVVQSDARDVAEVAPELMPAPLTARLSTSGIPALPQDRLSFGTLDF